MTSVACPSCSTVVELHPGVVPQCPRCGFQGPLPAAQPTQAWTAAPAWGSPAPAAQAYGAPPYASTGAPMQRPGLVTAAGVICIIYACLALLAGLVVLAFGSLLGVAGRMFIPSGFPWEILPTALFAAVGLVIIVLAVLFLVLGQQVLRGRSWARWTLVALCAFGALGSFASFARGGISFTPLVDIFIIVALVVPQSNAWFQAVDGPAAPRVAA